MLVLEAVRQVVSLSCCSEVFLLLQEVPAGPGREGSASPSLCALCCLTSGWDKEDPAPTPKLKTPWKSVCEMEIMILEDTVGSASLSC